MHRRIHRRGKLGAGAFILRKSGRTRNYFCSLRENTKQSKVIAVKATAKALIYNDPSGKRIVFHVDNQATLKPLDSTDITNRKSRCPYRAFGGHLEDLWCNKCVIVGK
jgi:hypothetical protein